MKKIKRHGRYFVYIVECQDGTYYTGYTPDIEKRIALHNNGKGAKYTRNRRPVKLAWCKEYKYFKRAFLEERRIKALTREQKDRLVKLASNPKQRKNFSLKSSSIFSSPGFDVTPKS